MRNKKLLVLINRKALLSIIRTKIDHIRVYAKSANIFCRERGEKGAERWG